MKKDLSLKIIIFIETKDWTSFKIFSQTPRDHRVLIYKKTDVFEGKTTLSKKIVLDLEG